MSRGPKLTMSSAPSETTCGTPGRAGGLQPVGAGREHAADELVGELGRRRVEHAGEEAVADERLHRLAARSGRVEDEHLVPELLEPLPRARHARRRDAEHRRRRRAASPPAPAPSPAPCPRSRRAAFAMIRAETRLTPEMSTTEYIIVTSTAPRRDACRRRRRSRPSASGRPPEARAWRARDRRAAGAAQREDPVEPPVGVEALHDLLGAFRHRGHGGAAVARGRQARRRRSRRPVRPRRARRPARSRAARARPASTTSTSTPRSRNRSRRKAYSVPFVSSVPRRTTCAQSTRR